MKMLPGKRIYLRQFEMSDKEIVLRGANEPEGAHLTGTRVTFTMDQIEAYILRNQEGTDRAAWVICTHQDEIVGEVVINEIDEDNRSANIRIALYEARHFGHGYGTEALHLAIDFGFTELNLHRISLGVFDFNPRAVHVYETLGFQHEGISRDALLWDGEFHNEIRMSILRPEWIRLQQSRSR